MLHGKKVRPTTITIVVIIVFLFLLNRFVFNPTPGGFGFFGSKVKELAEEMNKMVPVNYDAETRLDSVEAPGGSKLVYYITCRQIKKQGFNVDSFRVAKKPVIIVGLRDLPNLKFFTDNEVVLITRYYDNEGVFLTEITASPKEYDRKYTRGLQ